MKRFRGLYKPPGMPRIDPALAPRGLKICLPFADPAWTALGPRFPVYPAHVGSTIVQAPTYAGTGPKFSNITGATNSIGYQVDFTSNVTLEVLFISGSAINAQSICMWNQNNDGSNVTEDKGFFFDSSSRLNGYVFSGGATPVTDTTTTYTANTLYHAVLVADGVHATLYLNGKQVAQVAATSSYTGYSNPVFWIFGSTNTSGGLIAASHTMLLANYSSEAWSPEEVAQRAADPFNFLIYPEDDLFATLVGVGGGGGTVTVTFTKGSYPFTGLSIAPRDILSLLKGAFGYTGRTLTPQITFTMTRGTWGYTGKSLFPTDISTPTKGAFGYTGRPLSLTYICQLLKGAFTFQGRPFTGGTTIISVGYKWLQGIVRGIIDTIHTDS